MKIIQIVGYKNSGKTTIAEILIELFSRRGIRVASLKHHGHGGLPLGMETTDSEKHRQAGALIAGVEGEKLLQLSSEDPWKMEQMIAIYKLLNIELLVMEGFKQYHYNKIVLIRGTEDLHLLEQLANIQAVITQVPLKQTSYPFPIFKRDELEIFKNWVISFITSKREI